MEVKRNLREELILAGIDEINIHGANGFSVRRVAGACKVSSAAPYKHFKDKEHFIFEIAMYIYKQWSLLSDQVCSIGGDRFRLQTPAVPAVFQRHATPG
jgi:AcrR family transcriptional regulator